MADETMFGTIKRMKIDKGFGFLRPDGARDDRTDHFFHMSGVTDARGFEALQEGMRVAYEEEPSPKGLRAMNVREAR